MGSRGVILTGAEVFTGNRSAPWARSIGIGGRRIRGVGDPLDVRRTLPGAPEVDLGGRVVLPGLIDAHNHFVATGESLAMPDVRAPGVGTAEQLLAVVGALAAPAEPDAILSAYGFDHGKYPGGRYPTRDELDRVSPQNPVLLYHVSGHHVLVNSAALRLAGVDGSTPDPPGGRLVRDAQGALTGLCLDAAMALVVPTQVDIGSHGPNFHTVATRDQLVEAVDRAGRAFLEAGLTTVCDAQVTSRELTAYRDARARGLLHVRAICMPLSHQLGDYGRLGIATGLGDDELAIGPLKLYADGTLTGGTAAFTQGSGVAGRFRASFFNEPDRLRELVTEAYAQGWRVGVHAQGDLAIEAVLAAFSAAAAGVARVDLRPRIEHAGYPTRQQIATMASLGVVPVTQPAYLFDNGDQYRDLLGPLADELQPWRRMLDAGLRVVISSDSDVSDYRPLETLRHAVLRTSSGGDVLGEDQRLSLEEALFAHTIDAAFACGWEDRVGSIEEGKLADLAILGSDRAGLEPDVVSGSARVAGTLVGGDVRYDADGSFTELLGGRP